MSERELDQLFRRASRDIDARQRARIRDLKGVERELFEAMVRGVIQVLDDGHGRIRTGRGSASINRLIDAVFVALEKTALRKFHRAASKDLFAILGHADSYGLAIAREVGVRGARFDAIQKSVDHIMRRRIGIDAKGVPVRGGRVEQWARTDAMRKEVKQTIHAAVQSGAPIGKLARQLEVTIKGTKATPGLLKKHLSAYIFDEYQAFDRITTVEYAKKLGLSAFVYRGGLIETSRKFCRKHNGKVFTLEEAERDWPKDPDLPRTSAERESGVLVGYNGPVDMGRWNCRHRIRPITPGYAYELRPDLRPE